MSQPDTDQRSGSEFDFRALADVMPQMVWTARPDGRRDYHNARCQEFTGAPSGAMDGEGWSALVHPDDRERAQSTWRRAVETGAPFEIECRLRRHSGEYRWMLSRAVAARDDQGGVVRWFGACTDIDDLKRLEQGRDLVSQELSHRIKNIFAVVGALIALSARRHPEAKAFADALRARVDALARAHAFVRPHTEASRPTLGPTTLHAFLADLFQAYRDEGDADARVRITGDDAVFDDQAATAVALLFNELATNAAKYGALSVPEGRVDLETARDGDRFRLSWTETGGPRLEGPPGRSGFGSALTALSVEGQLGGRLSREWRPEGLKIVADLPTTALSPRRAAKMSAPSPFS